MTQLVHRRSTLYRRRIGIHAKYATEIWSALMGTRVIFQVMTI